MKIFSTNQITYKIIFLRFNRSTNFWLETFLVSRKVLLLPTNNLLIASNNLQPKANDTNDGQVIYS